jgi:ribosomal protein S27AE
LFAISITGLMLTASYTWMKGYAYDFLAILHAITVIFTLLWLPFGKFFHIFQRPAQLGVSFYKEVGQRESPAKCRRCGASFTSQMKVTDLIEVERRLGYRYEIDDGRVEHYQWICPPCRRSLFALAQGQIWKGELEGVAEVGVLGPTPMLGNYGPNQGPLGEEDRRNFHP